VFNAHYRTNAAGMRETDDALVAPEVIFLGDSFPMGWGLEQDETFPQNVARMTDLKTLNTGITSYETAREILLFETLDRSNLKAGVVQYGDNDFAENQFFVGQGKLCPSDQKQFDRLSRKAARNTRYFPFKYVYSIFRLLTQATTAPPPTPDQEAEALLPLLRRIIEAAGGPGCGL
jgi:hypothetical protein